MPWELRACDNLDPAAGLSSMPDRSVDVVITDPPYSPKVHECSRRGASGYRKRGCEVLVYRAQVTFEEIRDSRITSEEMRVQGSLRGGM